MPTMADELFRVFRVVGPDVIGRKKSRKLVLAMIAKLSEQTPTNGCGPIVGMRREAQQFLESGLREMDKDRE